MKISVFFILTLVGYFSCSTTEKRSKSTVQINKHEFNQIDTCENSDSLLRKYAATFEPYSISLNKSIASEFEIFITSIDTNCLRKQKEYKHFISVILAKLYSYHLKCCNQGYNLYDMKEGAASLIIREFELMAGYSSKKLEFLNSAKIVDFINGDEILKKDKSLKTILWQIY